LFNKFICVNI